MAAPVQAADEAPDALIDRLTKEVLDTIQADKAMQAGNVSRIIELVDEKVMPHVNFQRMTASAVGPGWRQATPEQRKRLRSRVQDPAGAHLCRRHEPGQRPELQRQALARRAG